MTERSHGFNIDAKTVEGFGKEWAAYDQSDLPAREHQALFDAYFSCFPFEDLPDDAEGFDLGCGSGRWALLMADRVRTLHCIDPAAEALDVACRRLDGKSGVQFHLAGVDGIPLPDDSQDFGYALGVLHHVPDTAAAMASCVRKLKPGAPFLVYLYYALDNRPLWFRGIWRVTDCFRWGICRLPFPLRKAVASLAAATIYFPLARLSALLEKQVGADVSHIPLSSYRTNSFYTMRTDALDRFGTRLEQRFTRRQIQAMMEASGLTEIRFREEPPYWVACGHKAARTDAFIDAPSPPLGSSARSPGAADGRA